MHYPFSEIALRQDQRTEGRETRKASTPTGPGRDAIAKSVMVYTAVPPDYCNNDVADIVQQAPSDVNPLEKDRPIMARGETDLYFQGIGLLSCMTD
jgi:hypothetical protein